MVALTTALALRAAINVLRDSAGLVGCRQASYLMRKALNFTETPSTRSNSHCPAFWTSNKQETSTSENKTMHPVAAILWIGTSVITGAVVLGLARVLSVPPGIDFMCFVFAATLVLKTTQPYFLTLRAEKATTSPRPGIDTFRKDVTSWRTSALGFSMLHYGLGIAGIASSSLAAAHPTLIVRDATVGQLISWMAAFTTALITFFGAQAKATRLTEAAMRLQVAVGRFDIDPTYTFNHVADAHAECVKLLRAGK